jgi:endonuclease/exonuclease/phosphatase (EEP) superfamily protein YafD
MVCGRDHSVKAESPTSLMKINALVLLPLVLAVVLRVAGELFPPDEVWGHMGHSIGLSAWPWLCLFAPLWALLARYRSGRWTKSMYLAIAVAPLAGIPPLPDSGEGRPVLVANVNAYMAGRTDLQNAMADLQADVVIQVEARVKEIPGMVALAHNFDAQVSRPSHYTAAFCVEEASCTSSITEEFGYGAMVMPMALVRVADQVCVMGVHGPPPVPFNIEGLLPYMRKIAESIEQGRLREDWGACRKGDPVIVAGDMNAVPGSWAIREFKGRGLRNMTAWRGVWATSWPSGGDWINLPLMQLDHVWAGDVEVGDVRTVRLPGSDHQGLFFRIKSGR